MRVIFVLLQRQKRKKKPTQNFCLINSIQATKFQMMILSKKWKISTDNIRSQYNKKQQLICFTSTKTFFSRMKGLPSLTKSCLSKNKISSESKIKLQGNNFFQIIIIASFLIEKLKNLSQFNKLNQYHFSKYYQAPKDHRTLMESDKQYQTHKNLCKNCECQQETLNKEMSQKLNINHEPQQMEEKENQPQEGEQENEQNQEQQENEQEDDDSEGYKRRNKWKVIEEPQKTVKLYMIDFAHCDAKKCSGKKLQRFKLLTTLDKKKKFKGVVLSAFGKKEVSFQDLQYAQKYGVCVVDCSWNRIEQTREFRFKHERKLPFVTAGNPVNYGKPYQLSCAEALATALCAIGYIDQAQYIMSKFGWADGFWSLNPSIDNYSKCKTLEQLKVESKRIEEEEKQTFQRNYDLSDPQSSDEQN